RQGADPARLLHEEREVGDFGHGRGTGATPCAILFGEPRFRPSRYALVVPDLERRHNLAPSSRHERDLMNETVELQIEPHPLLRAAAFTTRFPRALGAAPSPAWLTALFALECETPVRRDEAAR